MNVSRFVSLIFFVCCQHPRPGQGGVAGAGQSGQLAAAAEQRDLDRRSPARRPGRQGRGGVEVHHGPGRVILHAERLFDR